MSTTLPKLLTLGSCSVFSLVGYAQSPRFEEVTSTHLPAALAGACMDAAAGDADGDGDLDLVLAMEFETNVLLLNDGSARFTDASLQLPRTAHDSEDVVFADFDGDGHLDLVFASEDDRKDELWLNDGRGQFTDVSERLEPDDVSNALVVMDLNGDGFPDVLTGNIGIDRALINDGTGRFRDETATRWPQDGESRTQDLELADVGGDGDLDVIVANEGQNQLFINEGGVLTNRTTSNLPQREDESREIRAADVDGDGDLDLLVANVQFIMREGAQDYLLLNDGRGVFTDAAISRFPEDARSNFTIQTVDLDNDGDLDVIAPSTVFPRGEFDFAVVSKAANGALQIARGPFLDIRDIDADGAYDVVIRDDSTQHTMLNRDGFLTSDAGPPWHRLESLQITPADASGAVLGYVNVALESLVQSMSSVKEGGSATPMLQLIDLNGDGSVEIIAPMVQVMEAVGDYLVLGNDGAGNFSVAPPGTLLPADIAGNGFDVEVADFDGDGRNDLFLCHRASVSDGGAAISSGGLQRLLLGR